jgi:hypothetical protein
MYVDGIKAVKNTLFIQISAGIMLGSFYSSGMIDSVLAFTEGLTGTAVKIGGGLAITLVGMMTGSQSTAQNTIVPFLAPMLTEQLGVSPTLTALGVAHIAGAGQSFPPSNLTAFVVAGIVGGVLAVKTDPIKISIYAIPVTVVSLAIGFVCLFI